MRNLHADRRYLAAVRVLAAGTSDEWVAVDDINRALHEPAMVNRLPSLVEADYVALCTEGTHVAITLRGRSRLECRP